MTHRRVPEYNVAVVSNAMGDRELVELNWIRHGYSCANKLQDFESKTASAVRPLITRDAILSNEGINQTKSLNGLMITPTYSNYFDVILCSSMRRAMETALFVFNDPHTRKRLIIAPFISEARHKIAKALNVDLENVPLGLRYLRPYFEDLNVANNFNIDVDFSLLEKYERSKVDLSPDYNKFVKQALPDIIKMIGHPKHPDRVYRIGIVSHNHFIAHHFHQFGVGAIKNTEMWREKLELQYNSNFKSMIVKNLPVTHPVCPPNFNECKNQECLHSQACQVWPGKPPPNIKINPEAASLGRCEKHGKLYTRVGEHALRLICGGSSRVRDQHQGSYQ